MDKKKIRELIELFKESKLDELSLEQKDFKITMKNNANVIRQNIQYVQESNYEEKVDINKSESEKGTWVKAPFVGTYYCASSENAKPFVEVGQNVKEGDVLFIIEAMKVMNEIKAPKSGKIVKIQGQNGVMVEYGQELILIGD